jgi:hypothetical protein
MGGMGLINLVQGLRIGEAPNPNPKPRPKSKPKPNYP